MEGRQEVVPPEASSVITRRISVCEWLWVVGLIGIVLLINLATGARFPAVWLDEVQHTDPAVNLLLGKGFTSSAWYLQNSEEFWAGSVPLHHGLLFLWMKLFGFNLLAVRSLNYLEVAAAVFLLWWTLRRMSIVTTPNGRLLFVLLALMGYGVSICYRGGRYDGITILLAAAATAAFSLHNPHRRLVVLLLCGVAFPFAGLQLAAFAVVFCALLLLFTRFKWLRECFALGAGIGAGGVGLLAFYSANGVWSDFVATFHYSVHIVTGSLPKDPSFFLLLVPALLAGLWQWQNGRLRLGSPLVFGLIASIWIPVLMKIIGRFPTYYSWMAYLPLAVGFATVGGEIFQSGSKVRRATLATLASLPCLVGLPMQLGSTFWFWQERDYRAIEALVEQHVRPTDWVYSDPEAYYAVKPRAAGVCLSSYEAVRPEENARITVMILRPEHAEGTRLRLGGNWKRAAETGRAITRPYLWYDPARDDNKLIWDYNLEVWHRQPSAN